MATTPYAALPPLDTGAAPLHRLRELYERTLLERLNEVDADEVTLVLSSRIATLLTHVLVPRGLEALKSSRVVECVEIADDITRVHCHTVVYLTLARVSEVRAVAMHARSLHAQASNNTDASQAQAAAPHAFFIYATGKWTSLCDEVLEQFELHERVQVGNIPMGFVPLDTDVLTLGYERCLYDCGVTGNRSALIDVAVALNQMQDVFGQFEHIKYKGELSMLVLNHMVELSARAESDLAQRRQTQTSSSKRSRMDTLIMLDRRVDYASALSTPLTYEALLDEILHIHDGFISLSPMLLTSDPNASDAPIPFALNSTDAVFAQIRSLNVHAIPSVLNAQASALKTSFKRFQSSSATASAAEVHEFVKGVPQMKASQQHLERHINLLEYLDLTTGARTFRDQWKLERAIMDSDDSALREIQEMVFRHAPLAKVLRLLCLYCVVHDGLSRLALERMKLHLVRTYGHELLFSFENLERLGLLFEHGTHRARGGSSSDASADAGARRRSSDGTGRSRFLFAADTLRVIDLDINVENPKSAAYVTSGYAPISVRLVEEVLNAQSWRAIDAAMSCFHGPRAELSRVSDDEQQRRQHKAATKPKKPSKRKRVVMVCFIGGVTHVEIAALRWLSQFCTSRIASCTMAQGLVAHVRRLLCMSLCVSNRSVRAAHRRHESHERHVAAHRRARALPRSRIAAAVDTRASAQTQE